MSYATQKLRDISVIKTGKLDSNAAVENGAYPFFTCDPQTLRINKWAYDTEAVLLAGNNASGNYTAKYYRGKFNAYQRTYIIEAADSERLSVRFLCYAINQQLRLLKAMSSGSTTKFLTIRMLHNLDIPCPEIEVQDRIVNVLGTIDDLIENNQKQIKLLEETARRLYKEWFVNFRFPGYEDTPIVDGVPEGWEIRPSSDVFTFIRGKSYTSKELSNNQGTLMVNLKNISAFGGYNRNAEKRFTGKYKEEQQLTPGDIIMGVTDMTQERRLVGHTAMVPDLKEKMTFSMDLIKLIPISVSKNYLYGTMLYGGFSYKISPLANGVNVLHLKPEAIMNLPILVPSSSVMEAFDNVFNPICFRIESLQEQIDVASEARDRLLPKLMSGEIEV
ncbi:MAG: restriction endonuclease subunit S [Christensenellales bacterium]